MTMTLQITVGSALLLACTLLHAAALVFAGSLLRYLNGRLANFNNVIGWTVAMTVTVFGIVMAHSVQVWIWAAALRLYGAFANLEEAIYYAIVTYTTVGFGDVVLPPSHRIFGAMASVSGLLSFGLSTAFLVGLFGRMLPRSLRG